MNEGIWEVFFEAWHEVIGEYQYEAQRRECKEHAAVEVVSGEAFEALMKKVQEEG